MHENEDARLKMVEIKIYLIFKQLALDGCWKRLKKADDSVLPGRYQEWLSIT